LANFEITPLKIGVEYLYKLGYRHTKYGLKTATKDINKNNKFLNA